MKDSLLLSIIFWIMNAAGMLLILTIGLNGKMSGLYAIMGGNLLVLCSFFICMYNRSHSRKQSNDEPQDKNDQRS